MTTSALASQSPDRMAQVHKANQPKSGQQTPQTPVNNFAALMLLVDGADPAPDLTLTQPTDPKDDLLGKEAAAAEAATDLSPGQAALLGLMNWQNFNAINTNGAGTAGTRTSGLSMGAPQTQANPATTPTLPTLQGPTGQQTAPTEGSLRGITGAGMDLGTAPTTDEAVTAEVMAALRSASADPGVQTSQPARASAVHGLMEPPGAKPKPGSLRHALATPSATTTSSATPPSTVSLAAKSVAGEVVSNASTQPAAMPKSSQTVDVPTPGKDTALPTDLASASTPSSKPQEAGNGQTAIFSAANMDHPGLDTGAAVPPDMPTMPTPESMEHTMEQLGAHIAYWASQGNQRASLTIGDQQNNPLGVNISFENGEVHVHFETDEAEIKDALSLSAEDMLHQMLEAKGMALGDVSIGTGQGGQRSAEQSNADAQGQSQAQRSNQVNTASSASSPSQGAQAADTTTRKPSVISSTKLDFFA